MSDAEGATGSARMAVPAPGGPVAAPEAEVTLVDILSVLRRYRMLLLASLAAGVGLAVLALAWLQPVYIATAELMIEPARDAASDGMLASAAIADDDGSIESEVQLLASRTMARQVIKALDLALDPELHQALDPAERLAIGLGIAHAAAEVGDPVALVDRFLQRLTVERVGDTHVISIAFKSHNAATSARIANGVAEQYMAARLDAKADIAGGTGAWLEEALTESKAELDAAEAELAAYRASAGGELADALTLDNLDLASLRRDTAAAAADRAASEARLRRVRAVLAQPSGDIAFEELGGSTVLENLYALKNQTTRREAELATRFGERHPQMLDIRAERRELERRIEAEQQALLGSVAAEIEAAEARERTLVRELDALKSQSVEQGRAAAGLARHERAVASARAQYEAYLTRFRALGDVVETSRPDVRLISEATPPQRPSFPQPVMLFGLFSAASLGTGLLAVFFLEQLDRGFRTQRAAEQGLGRRCIGCLPVVRQGRRDARIVDLPLELPNGRFSEALRTLVAEFGFAHPAIDCNVAGGRRGSGGSVVLMTSAVPGEGKSTTCVALARLAAAEGLKVLLVDADLRKPRLAELLEQEAPIGLVEILRGEREAEDVLLEDPATGLAFIPGSARVSQPTRLLGPKAMGILLAEARQHFDLVLVDSPPVLVVSDARVMAPLCDAILFLVRWHATQRALAADALRQLEGVADRVLGTVLTMADPTIAAPLGAADSRLVRREISKYYAEG
jgi:capsular exopolysaccharide synthesis family protein